MKDTEEPERAPNFVIGIAAAIDVLENILSALREIEKVSAHASLTPLGIRVEVTIPEKPEQPTEQFVR